MKKIVISLFLVFIFSCTNHQNNSFNDLSQSFYDWKIKFEFNPFDKKYRQELNGTLKRFSLELNQINKKKLAKNNINNYRLIKDYIDKEMHENGNHGPYKWNLLELLQTCSLKDLDLIKKSIQYRYKDEKQIKLVEKFIQQRKKHGLVRWINESTIHPEDQSKFLEFWSWYINIYSKFNEFNNNSQIDFLRSNILQIDYSLDSLLDITYKSMENYKNIIFDLSLPIYLSSNDEPLWTDFSDTISVIDWSLNSIDSNIKSMYYSSTNGTDEYLHVYNLINSSGNKIDTVVKDQSYIEAYILTSKYRNIIINNKFKNWIKDRFKILFYIQRLEDAIKTVSALRYYIYEEDIVEIIDFYNDLGIIEDTSSTKYDIQFPDERFLEIRLNIYTHDYTDIIKFLSYNMLINAIHEEPDEIIAYEYLILLLENNLNTNLKNIKDISSK